MAESDNSAEPETKTTVIEKKVTKGKKAKVSDGKKTVSKVKKVKSSASHPKYSVMIESAVKALKEKKGCSRQAILKYLTANYSLEPKKAGVQVRLALKRAVAGGSLKMARESGKGAGCYKLNSQPEKKKQKTKSVTKPKKETKTKPVTKKQPEPKKALVKKPATKKSAQKKSPKKK